MNNINWEVLADRFWKPVPGQEYIVEFANPRIELKNFGKKDEAPKACLVLDVHSISYGGIIENFKSPREFATTNRSFIENVRNIVDRAVMEQRPTFFVQLRKDTKGQFSIFSWAPAVTTKTYSGVKLNE